MRVEEVFVGRDDRAVQRELDHRLRLADRRDLAGVFGVLQILRAVMSMANFTTLNGLPLPSRIGIVGRLNPDFLAALAEPLVLGGLVFAAIESFAQNSR